MTPRPEWVECEVDTYWRAVVTGINRAVSSAGEAGSFEIAGMATACQGETLIALGVNGEPLRPAMVWLDNRASVEAAELETAFGLDGIYERTGQIESLPTWTAAKILWIKKNEPGIHERVSKYMLLEDWLIYRLTGQAVGEKSLYVTSLLLDIGTRQWWAPMLERIGIDAGHLPAIVDPGAVVGRLAVSAAQELGLAPGVPVVAGALDQVLAATGAANLRPGLLTENTGTVLGLATCLRSLPPNRSAALPICLHVVPDMYCAQPCGQTAGVVLQWFRDNFFGGPRKFPQVPLSYETVIEEAASVPPGSDGTIVIPHLAGAQYPEFNPAARAAIVGLTMSQSRGHIGRAVMEAVAFMLRNALESMRAGGVHIEEICSLGNSARSDFWTQLKADVCQLPVKRLECPEPTLLGAAMLVGVAVGDFADVSTAGTAMVRVRDVVEPDPSVADVYDRAFANYKWVYQLLSSPLAGSAAQR